MWFHISSRHLTKRRVGGGDWKIVRTSGKILAKPCNYINLGFKNNKAQPIVNDIEYCNHIPIISKLNKNQ